MDFISFEFFLFAALLIFLYFFVPKKYQWMILLGANVTFYLSAGLPYLIFILFTCISSFSCAAIVEKVKEKYKRIRERECHTREEKQKNKAQCIRVQKRIMAVCLILNFGIWILLKYTVFPEKILGFILPLGISFYTFIAMGYCIDVYRGKYQAERNLAKYALFLSFFPHIVQGPFSRYNNLGQTLFEVHDFSWERFKKGSYRILWGIFKKTVVACRFGIIADTIYDQQVPYSGFCIVLLMIAVTLRLYADFSGYMDIAAGICRILGIRLEENFRQPFFSRSIEEFWRRWHITLGAWFRDYLFYPVSMSKRVQGWGRKCREKFGASFGRMLPSYIALFLVWTATGLWHGATKGYLIWGWMNLVIIVTSMLMAPVYEKWKNGLHIQDDSRWWQGIQMLRTFLVFGYMEMFSCACSVRQALSLTLSMFRWKVGEDVIQTLFAGMKVYDYVILLVGTAFMLIVDIVKEKQIELWGRINGMPTAVRYIGIVGVIYMILIFGDIGSDAAKGFMYAQF